ncbi:MAG: hypothetical protein H6R02_3056, partial [Burkholderiaceae bacterium]|nr:hypothetical protein [Burkholderiaceae bacterium]
PGRLSRRCGLPTSLGRAACAGLHGHRRHRRDRRGVRRPTRSRTRGRTHRRAGQQRRHPGARFARRTRLRCHAAAIRSQRAGADADHARIAAESRQGLEGRDHHQPHGLDRRQRQRRVLRLSDVEGGREHRRCQSCPRPARSGHLGAAAASRHGGDRNDGAPRGASGRGGSESHGANRIRRIWHCQIRRIRPPAPAKPAAGQPRGSHAPRPPRCRRGG